MDAIPLPRWKCKLVNKCSALWIIECCFYLLKYKYFGKDLGKVNVRTDIQFKIMTGAFTAISNIKNTIEYSYILTIHNIKICGKIIL